MSVTSATESFIDGAELFDQEKYQTTVTTSLDPDPTQIEQAFNTPLSQRIIQIHSYRDSIYGEWRLDDVLIRCPSEAFRKHQKQQWSALKNEAEERGWWWTVTAIGSGALAGAGGVLLALDKQLGSVLLIVGAIAAIASLIFMAKENASFNQAHAQIVKWDADPVRKVGDARNEAHNKGFPYIYEKNLKLEKGKSSTTALFHPLQVQYEYKKYFESFCKKLLDRSTLAHADWMNLFRSYNPVSSDLMLYGLGHIPEHMKPVVDDLTNLRSRLDDISTSYDQLKSDVRETAYKRIESNKKMRTDELKPYVDARDADIRKAEADRNKVLNDPFANEKQRQEARKAFNTLKETIEDNYTRSVRPINKKYEKEIQKAEQERDTHITQLSDQKLSQLNNNFIAARELLVRAKDAWDNKGYTPVNFQRYFPYQTTQPAWTQPPFHPSLYPPVLPTDNNRFGHFDYGRPPQQQGFFVLPSAPALGS